MDIKLKLVGDAPNYMPGTHHLYHIVLNGKQTIGSLVHRLSKDEYTIQYNQQYGVLDYDYLKKYRSIYLFDKDLIENALSEELSTLFENLSL